jgi:hypothetical protein
MYEIDYIFQVNARCHQLQTIFSDRRTATLGRYLSQPMSRVRRWRGVVRLACGAHQTARFHPLLIEPDMRISLHPALGQSITRSLTTRPDQGG